MKNKIERRFAINGCLVTFEADIGKLKVYSTINKEEDRIKYLFVQDDLLIKTLEISADCGQNVGYISQHKFNDVKGDQQ